MATTIRNAPPLLARFVVLVLLRDEAELPGDFAAADLAVLRFTGICWMLAATVQSRGPMGYPF